MNHSLGEYESIVGKAVIRQLRTLGEKLKGLTVVHVNSTSEGGGVAEILAWLVPLMRELGLDAQWRVIRGTPAFFKVTKSIHNGLQGTAVSLTRQDWDSYRQINTENLKEFGEVLERADIVVIHDPQPAPLFDLCQKRRGKWIWRAHIDISRPSRPVWKALRTLVMNADASIFSMSQFAQALPHPQFIMAPSIDPLSDKNIDLPQIELEEARMSLGLDPKRPVLVQVSRFDRFKDPMGVIQAFRMVQKTIPAQLVLAGGGATDDPEGMQVLDEVRGAAGADQDIHILLLPNNAHRTINALQRLSDIVIQKSTKEGFGLRVTEGLWKGKSVIGGDVGGIQLQVTNHHTGYLVNTPEGAALRIRFLLDHREKMMQMGVTAREFVRENFLLTRNLRDYLTLIAWLLRGEGKHTITV